MNLLESIIFISDLFIISRASVDVCLLRPLHKSSKIYVSIPEVIESIAESFTHTSKANPIK